MKKKNVLIIVTLLFCLALTPSMGAFAKERVKEMDENAYSNINQMPYVNHIDEYLAQLNAGLIVPKNTTITTYERPKTPIAVYGIIADPSKNCSNIFGHKWSNWTNWSEVQRIHRSSGSCISMIERVRFCTRTYCGASQKETDGLWISCKH